MPFFGHIPNDVWMFLSNLFGEEERGLSFSQITGLGSLGIPSETLYNMESSFRYRSLHRKQETTIILSLIFYLKN